MKEWTIMVYLAGNNNLSDDMIAAINGIKTGMSAVENNIAVLAQYDCQHPTVPTHRYDFLETLSAEELINSDFDSIGESIYEFVDWCVQKHPARRYALILSGHGDGFQGRTLLLDESPHRVLTSEELRETLENVKTNLLDNQKIDILGFDSCVMNTLEGLYEIRDLTSIWIGSQGSIPNSGWAYEKIVRGLANLNESRLREPKEVAKVFVTEFIEHSKNYAFGGRSVDISACNLSEVGAIAEKIDELSKILVSSLQDNPDNSLIKQTVERILLSSHWKSQTFMFEQTVDIRDFCENLQEECTQIQKNTFDIFSNFKQTKIAQRLVKRMDDIYSICQSIIDSISVGRLVIKSAFSGVDYQYSHGISLFFPWSYLTLNISQASYGRLEFVRDAGKNWWDFLELYLDLTMRNPRNKSESKHDYLPALIKPSSFFASNAHRSDPTASSWSSEDRLNPPNKMMSDRLNPPNKNNHMINDKLNSPTKNNHLINDKLNPPNKNTGIGNDKLDVHSKNTGIGNDKLNPPNKNTGIGNDKLNSQNNSGMTEGRSNSPASRDNMPFKRLNHRAKGLGNFTQYFGRTKNFPLNLKTSGGEEEE